MMTLFANIESKLRTSKGSIQEKRLSEQESREQVKNYKLEKRVALVERE